MTQVYKKSNCHDTVVWYPRHLIHRLGRRHWRNRDHCFGGVHRGKYPIPLGLFHQFQFGRANLDDTILKRVKLVKKRNDNTLSIGYKTYLYTHTQVLQFVIQDELPYKRQWHNLVVGNQIWQIMVWDWSTIMHVVTNEMRKCHKYVAYCCVSLFLQDHHTTR